MAMVAHTASDISMCNTYRITGEELQFLPDRPQKLRRLKQHPSLIHIPEPEDLPTLPSPLRIPAMAQPVHVQPAALPLPTEHGTPQFVEASRETVEQYFEDLKHLLSKHHVNDAAARKCTAINYVSATVARRWKSLPFYAAGMYDTFKAEILEFYIGMDNNHQWTLCEYNALVGDTFHTGILDLRGYTKFYRKFYPIYKYLASKTHPELTERDTSIALLRLISVQYAGAISACLSHKVPDEHQEDAYMVAQAHESVSYCLADAGPFGGLGGLPHLGQVEHATASPVPETTRATPPVAIKAEPTSDQLRSEIFQWCPRVYAKHCEASSQIWAGEHFG